MQRHAPLLSALVLATFAARPAQAQWSSATSLSLARSNMAGVTVGKFAVFAGGNVVGLFSKKVDIYDSVTDTWTSSFDLSQFRTQIAATTVGNLALFGGGYGVGGVHAVVDVFDAQSASWWPTPLTLSQARSDLAATTVGNLAIFAGGSTGPGVLVDTVDIYDASQSVWLPTQHLSLARGALSAASIGDLAIFAGGAGPMGTPYDRVDIYDTSTSTWSQAALSVPRSLGSDAVAVVGTRVYFGGGHNSFQGGATMYATVDIYDSAVGLPTDPAAWTVETLPGGARGYVAATAIGNTVLFAGGRETGTNAASSVVDMLNVGTGQWTTSTVLAPPREGMCAVTIGGKALFAGGQAGSFNPSAVVNTYEPVGVNYCAALPNSTGAAATIRASGSSSLSANDLVLTATGLPLTNPNFIFFHGSTQIQTPFGNGYRCVGNVVRMPLGTSNGGVAQFAVDLPSTGIAIPGAVRNFQCWFRDPAAGGAGSNTSDAIAISFQ